MTRAIIVSYALLHVSWAVNHHQRAGYYPDHERVTKLNHLADNITELVAHLDAGTFQLLQLICEFDENEGWSGHGIRSCAHWLNWKCGMSMGAARERVRVARALPELPAISAAFRTGKVSYSKVRAMTRVATPKSEKALLQIALHGTTPEPVSQKRADALARVVEGFLAGLGHVFVLMSGNQKNGLHITPETAVPRWHGEQMDNDTAVEMLLQYEPV